MKEVNDKYKTSIPAIVQCTNNLLATFVETNVERKSIFRTYIKVQVGKDQEKAQSEKDFHSKNRGEKKPN